MKYFQKVFTIFGLHEVFPKQISNKFGLHEIFPKIINNYICITWSISKITLHLDCMKYFQKILSTIFWLHEVFRKKLSTILRSLLWVKAIDLLRRLSVTISSWIWHCWYLIAWPEPVKLAVFLVLLTIFIKGKLCPEI